MGPRGCRQQDQVSVPSEAGRAFFRDTWMGLVSYDVEQERFLKITETIDPQAEVGEKGGGGAWASISIS